MNWSIFCCCCQIDVFVQFEYESHVNVWWINCNMREDTLYPQWSILLRGRLKTATVPDNKLQTAERMWNHYFARAPAAAPTFPPRPLGYTFHLLDCMQKRCQYKNWTPKRSREKMCNHKLSCGGNHKNNLVARTRVQPLSLLLRPCLHVNARTGRVLGWGR